MKQRENRKNPRRKIRIPVFCWETDDEKKMGRGKEIVSKDLSADGIAFYSAHIYPIGTIMLIDIYLPSRKDPVSCKLKVICLEAIARKEEYIIGAALVGLIPEDRMLIATAVEKMDLYLLLESMLVGGASDLHLTVGRPPIVRRDGRILPMAAEIIEEGQVEAMLYPLLKQEQIQSFEENKELDFAFSPDVNSRFRVNMHQQKGYVEATLRSIPTTIKRFEELNLPVETMRKLSCTKNGLILIVGTTGAGKTTTMSSMVDFINRTQDRVVITIEDPIEYTFKSQKSIIKQRELGTDTRSYAEALKRALRQDPDVICVGEILDKDCLGLAMRAAETGHVVISTMQAPDTISVIERIINFFPPDHVISMRQQLSSCLVGIVAQKLLPSKRGGQVAATEVFINTSAMQNIIREGKYIQMGNILQTGRSLGMHTFENSVKELRAQGLIDDQTLQDFLNSKKI